MFFNIKCNEYIKQLFNVKIDEEITNMLYFGRIKTCKLNSINLSLQVLCINYKFKEFKYRVPYKYIICK